MARRRIAPLPPTLESDRVVCRLKGKVYHARWTQDGERQERTTKARTAEGARAYMDKVNLQLERTGTADVVDLTLTVAAAFRKFEANYTGWRPCTWDGYRHWFTARILPAFGPRLLSSVTRRQLRAWLQEQRQFDRRTHVPTDEALAASSTNKLINCLSSFFAWCCDAGGLLPEDLNPAIKLGRQREPKYMDVEADALTEAQCDVVLAAMEQLSAAAGSPSPHAHYIVLLAVDTGLRRGELWALEWADIDFDRGTIRVDDSVDGLGTKTGNVRFVPMTGRVRGALKRRLETAMGESVVPRVNIRRSLNTAAQQAGLEKFRFHGLRHTAATRWFDSGMAISVVQRGLGHASLDMTRRYMQTRQTRLHEGIAGLDKMIQEKSPPKLTVSS